MLFLDVVLCRVPIALWCSCLLYVVCGLRDVGWCWLCFCVVFVCGRCKVLVVFFSGLLLLVVRLCLSLFVVCCCLLLLVRYGLLCLYCVLSLFVVCCC